LELVDASRRIALTWAIFIGLIIFIASRFSSP
jgi:hypothetical protein